MSPVLARTSFIGTLRAITWATTIQEVWQILVAEMDGHGFDRILYAGVAADGHGHGERP